MECFTHRETLRAMNDRLPLIIPPTHFVFRTVHLTADKFPGPDLSNAILKSTGVLLRPNVILSSHPTPMPAAALVPGSPLACPGTATSGDSIASTMLPLPAVASIPSTPRATEPPVDVSEDMNEQVVSTGVNDRQCSGGGHVD
ncbi:hypothetical protein SCUP515_08348 [Seiridium cupressi]